METRGSRRSPLLPVAVLLVLAALAGALTLAARGRAERPRVVPATSSGPAPVDLAARVDDYTADFAAGGPYTGPDATQRRAVADGVLGALDGQPEQAGRELARAGYRLTEFTEAATGRRVAEIADGDEDRGRGWGRVYLDLSARANWSVQVPHPVSDARTEALGVELFRAAPGGVLVLAGAHRRAGADGSSDVAHRSDTVFAAVVEALTGRGLPGIQVHGFDEGSLPGQDAVVSSGAGQAGPAAELTAAGLGRAGYAVCRAWREKCGQLEGTTNVEGRFAAGVGVPWLHVELGNGLRTEPARRAVVAGVLAETARSWGARP
ncbi:hypothetical protein ATKI12_2546 [Kitasatospora sp. Ki12]|uniref:hypothetical protein n=1 Tax=Kitasatospora xanthocidica TaxID=83382 RepID=UPI0016752A2F|nr:hypothetical protein [Kitasatospora xanthocidica]GHF49259.1 hypothetical protein GCM10018790_28840 [Kitasatospora xanthocidica]